MKKTQHSIIGKWLALGEAKYVEYALDDKKSLIIGRDAYHDIQHHSGWHYNEKVNEVVSNDDGELLSFLACRAENKSDIERITFLNGNKLDFRRSNLQIHKMKPKKPRTAGLEDFF